MTINEGDSEPEFESLEYFRRHPISYWEKKYFTRGGTYRVVSAFTDLDGTPHPVGEEWIFIGSRDAHFDSFYVLCVQLAVGNTLIKLSTTSGTSRDVAKYPPKYITHV